MTPRKYKLIMIHYWRSIWKPWDSSWIPEVLNIMEDMNTNGTDFQFKIKQINRNWIFPHLTDMKSIWYPLNWIANYGIGIHYETYVRDYHELLRPIWEDIYYPQQLLSVSERAIQFATQIYTENTFDLVPILGDMLEEENADESLIKHCRNGCKHYKGCWLIDNILKI